MFQHVRLICFDLDDTLWPCQPVIEAAEAECYAWLAHVAPRFTARRSPQELRDHRMALMQAQPDIAHDLGELRLRSLTELVVAEGYGPDIARQASAVFSAARNRVEPYAEVVEALQVLRGRYKLVSVTNGNAQIEHTPLRDCFDHSLTAGQVGAAKPDPAIFRAASVCSGVPLDAFLHVGDDPLRDIHAARRLGVSTVWVNRDGRDWPATLEPADLQVSAIDHLVQVLATVR